MENTQVSRDPAENIAWLNLTKNGWKRNSMEVYVQLNGKAATFRIIMDGKCPSKSGKTDVPTPLLANKIVLGDLADRTLRFDKFNSLIEPVAGSPFVTKRFEVLTQNDDSYFTARYKSDSFQL